MCSPEGGGYSMAAKIAKARKDNTGLEGVNLNNLKDSPRQLALTSALRMPSVQGVVLDVTRARTI